MTARERYARVLRAPGARGMLLAEIPARLPVGINGLAAILFVRDRTGSFASAGAVAAALAAAVGLTGPVIGRLIDQRGLRQVVLPLAVVHAIAMYGLIAATASRQPLGVLMLLAVLAGAFFPPLGSVSRSLWPRILREEDPGLLSTALALESVLIEIIFIAGPLVVAVIAAVGDPGVALALSPALLIAGIALFLVQPPARAWVISEHAGSHGMLGALRSPGLRTLILTTLPMGFCFGAMEVALPAFSDAEATRSASGALIAVWSVGSAIGGLWYGARHWEGPPGARFAKLTALLPLSYLPPVIAPSFAVMFLLALIAGVCIAPTMTAANQIAGDVAPVGAETEAYTWPITALVIGIAAGNWAAGAIAQSADWHLAFLAGAGGATLAALTATLRRDTLDQGAAQLTAR